MKVAIHIDNLVLNLDAPQPAANESLTAVLPINGIALPAIGEKWLEQGGLFAGMMRGIDGGPDYYLIVAPAEAGEIEEIEWGGRGEAEDGACHDQDGLGNTIALAQSAIDHPAAEWAMGLDINGHADWYLPSRREARLMAANVPDLFKPEWYWTSTQYSAYYAWVQGFVDGSQDIDVKANRSRARAVRRFLTP